MIAIESLTKRFGHTLAVDEVSLHVPQGSVFGLLGHNGAGKSTMIGMLLGQVFPDAGEVRIGGLDVFDRRAAALARVGALFEAPAFYDYLSGRRNLEVLSAYSGRPSRQAMDEAVALVNLEGRIDDRVGTYSHGMRQRLGVAQALLPRPEVLILDEPSDGLDPEGIREMREFIQRLHNEWNLTIFLSSHLLHEVQAVCTHVAVMREGRLLYHGPWGERRDERLARIGVRPSEAAQRRLQQEGWVESWMSPQIARLAESVTLPDLARWLVREGFDIETLGPHQRTLEDVYHEIVGPGRGETGP